MDRRARWLLAAIFVVIGLVLAPSQLTNILQVKLWGFPAFIGLLVLTVPFVFGPTLVGIRRQKQDWKVEHPGDSDIVASSLEARVRQKAYKAAGRRYSLRVFVPFLLGLIPLIFIDAALGISGALGSATFLFYILLFLLAQYVILRRASWTSRKSRDKLTHTIPIGMAREKKTVEKFERPKVADEADLELCPHCASAVPRRLGGTCPSCGKPLT
jgi:hypothetical protein